MTFYHDLIKRSLKITYVLSLTAKVRVRVPLTIFFGEKMAIGNVVRNAG